MYSHLYAICHALYLAYIIYLSIFSLVLTIGAVSIFQIRLGENLQWEEVSSAGGLVHCIQKPVDRWLWSQGDVQCIFLVSIFVYHVLWMFLK